MPTLGEILQGNIGGTSPYAPPEQGPGPAAGSQFKIEPNPSPERKKQLEKEWYDYFTDPDVTAALLQFGSSLAQPRRGGTFANIQRAIGDAGEAVARSQDRRNAEEQRRIANEQKQQEIDIAADRNTISRRGQNIDLRGQDIDQQIAEAELEGRSADRALKKRGQDLDYILAQDAKIFNADEAEKQRIFDRELFDLDVESRKDIARINATGRGTKSDPYLLALERAMTPNIDGAVPSPGEAAIQAHVEVALGGDSDRADRLLTKLLPESFLERAVRAGEGSPELIELEQVIAQASPEVAKVYRERLAQLRALVAQEQADIKLQEITGRTIRRQASAQERGVLTPQRQKQLQRHGRRGVAEQ